MDINLIGPVNKLGYGTHATNMLKALDSIGVNIALETVGEIQNTYHQELVGKCTAKNINPDNPTLHIYHDEYIDKVTAKNIISFTIFETDIVIKKL